MIGSLCARGSREWTPAVERRAGGRRWMCCVAGEVGLVALRDR